MSNPVKRPLMRAWSLIMPYLCNAEAMPYEHDYSNELIVIKILFGRLSGHANKKSLRISCAGFS
jgi:hypothetical protein